jgi:hypothetical protein
MSAIEDDAGAGAFQGIRADSPQEKKKSARQKTYGSLFLIRQDAARQNKTDAGNETGDRNPLRSAITRPDDIARKGMSNGRS